jgi:hypothetical protein
VRRTRPLVGGSRSGSGRCRWAAAAPGLAGKWQDTFLLSQAAEALFKLGRWDQARRLAAQALAQATPDDRSLFLTVAELEIGRDEFQAADARLELIKEQCLSPG